MESACLGLAIDRCNQSFPVFCVDRRRRLLTLHLGCTEALVNQRRGPKKSAAAASVLLQCTHSARPCFTRSSAISKTPAHLHQHQNANLRACVHTHATPFRRDRTRFSDFIQLVSAGARQSNAEKTLSSRRRTTLMVTRRFENPVYEVLPMAQSARTPSLSNDRVPTFAFSGSVHTASPIQVPTSIDGENRALSSNPKEKAIAPLLRGEFRPQTARFPRGA